MVIWLLCFWACEADQRLFMVEKKQSKEHVGRDHQGHAPTALVSLSKPQPGSTTIM